MNQPPSVRTMRIVDNWQQASREIASLLSDTTPIFLSRIGGSDTNAVAKYLALKERGILSGTDSEILWHRGRAAAYNGYYDRTNNVQTFFRYCDELISCHESSEHSFMCNSQLLSMYFPNAINKAFFQKEINNRDELANLVSRVTREGSKTFYFYELVESLVLNPWTLFNLFSTILPGKRVLVISPFSESIRKNFHNRHAFFKKYEYPQFELVTINSPITYAGLPAQLYPHSDWFETLASLRDEISREQFDVALLSCGSYAMPLGTYIAQSLNRKAIYVGGVLQLYFGIMGRRYKGIFFTDQLNLERFIYPMERDKYIKHVNLSEKAATEAFGAYF
jgi:hypothetical protein